MNAAPPCLPWGAWPWAARAILAGCRRIPSPAGFDEMWVFCRIDSHLATPALAERARNEAIYKGEKFSDHAPITIDYDWAF